MATAKTKTKKTTKAKTAKKVETKTPSFVRKGALAYLGLYGFAAERAQKRADQVKAIYAKTTDGLFEDLVERGEKVEQLALGTAKTAQKRVIETFEDTTAKVKAVPSKLPFGANDRVAELEAEVVALNKKIAALSKKAKAKATAINKDVMKTDKTVSEKAA